MVTSSDGKKIDAGQEVAICCHGTTTAAVISRIRATIDRRTQALGPPGPLKARSSPLGVRLRCQRQTVTCRDKTQQPPYSPSPQVYPTLLTSLLVAAFHCSQTGMSGLIEVIPERPVALLTAVADRRFARVVVAANGRVIGVGSVASVRKTDYSEGLLGAAESTGGGADDGGEALPVVVGRIRPLVRMCVAAIQVRFSFLCLLAADCRSKMYLRLPLLKLSHRISSR